MSDVAVDRAVDAIFGDSVGEKSTGRRISMREAWVLQLRGKETCFPGAGWMSKRHVVPSLKKKHSSKVISLILFAWPDTCIIR